MVQLLRQSPTKTFIPPIFNGHLLSIYYVLGSVLGTVDTTVKKAEKVSALLELIFQTFLLFKTYTRLSYPSLTLDPTHHLLSAFCSWDSGLCGRKSRTMLSNLKVCANFSWVITALQWCLSSAYRYQVTSGYKTLQQIPHLCSSNCLLSLQSFICPPPQILGGLRRFEMTLSELFLSVGWNGRGFHPTPYNTTVLLLLSNPAKMGASNMTCTRFLLSRSECFDTYVHSLLIFWFRKH